MDILRAYLSVNNMIYHGLDDGEIELIKEFIKRYKIETATPEFIQACSDLIDCEVHLILGGDNIVLSKLGMGGKAGWTK